MEPKSVAFKNVNPGSLFYYNANGDILVKIAEVKTSEGSTVNAAVVYVEKTAQTPTKLVPGEVLEVMQDVIVDVFYDPKQASLRVR